MSGTISLSSPILSKEDSVPVRVALATPRANILDAPSSNTQARPTDSPLQPSLVVPFRPLLCLMPTPEQSPAYIRSPWFTPTTPRPKVPLPTPVTASTSIAWSCLFPRQATGSPLVSPIRANDLQALWGLDDVSRRNLLEMHGLADDESDGESTPNAEECKRHPWNAAAPMPRVYASDDIPFMPLTEPEVCLHTPVRMVPLACAPAPLGASHKSRPSLSIITASRTGV
ncbi:hypothetical protein HGRIS_002167 [Hohenbuehelia grisea]|uniref:Uncharacterized protein n=1 Tax=Hohenbuehelia grisea TaxID=104357 RepID=A0ABR3JLJ8_9AGAR